MKKIFLLFSLVWASLFFLVACSNNSSSTTSQSGDTTAQRALQPTSRAALLSADSIYTCEMHQQVIGLKPGHCSVCGMALVKQKPTAQQTKMIQDSTYKFPTE